MNKIFLRSLALAFALIFIVAIQPVSAQLLPRVEDNARPEVKGVKVSLEEDHTHPEIDRKKITKPDGSNASGETMQSRQKEQPRAGARLQVAPLASEPASSAQASSPQPSAISAAEVPNLISNPDLETAGSPGLPQSWQKGGYGANTRTLTYPVTSMNGTKSIEVAITSYTGGDAKWFFNDVGVSGGSTYEFSDDYKSSTQSYVTVRFAFPNGTFTYHGIATLPPSATVQRYTGQFTAPAGATSATVFHLIQSVGTLSTDNYSLTAVGSNPPPPPPPPPPPTSGNLIPNGNFETTGTNGLPTGWATGKWGTNNAVFAYPVAGPEGSKAARVSMTTRTSGDAKWHFTPLALSAGPYTYSNQYSADVPTFMTVQFQNSSGGLSYLDIGTLPASSGWNAATANFTVPAGTTNVTVFHLLNRPGSLTIDNVSLTGDGTPPPPPPPGGNIFDTGAVTLRFDDNRISQQNNALPKLNSAGLKGTFYVVSRQNADFGFSGYMSIAQIKAAAAQGHEIGAHTRTHADLAALSSSQQLQEIQGARQDIIGWGGTGPVGSFAYPFGSYTATTIQIVKNAGFTSAAATIDGHVTLSSDPYQLERRPVNSNISLTQLKQWIDQADANNTWLILGIHDVLPSCGSNLYCTTTTTFNAMIDYLVQKGVPVVTTAEGIQSLQ